MANITLDIETLPCDDAALVEEIKASVKPPRTLKKAESIAAWWKEEGDAAQAEAVARTSLNGMYGRICCIGWKIGDAPAASISGGDEADLIASFFDVMRHAAMVDHYSKPVSCHRVIGHNIAGFDLRFLWQRAVVHQIARPACIPWKAKPWDDSINDTMLMWSPDRDSRISLDKLCKLLGIASSKGDLDGSKIAQAWADGRQSEIAEYCRADVEATYLCWQRMF